MAKKKAKIEFEFLNKEKVEDARVKFMFKKIDDNFLSNETREEEFSELSKRSFNLDKDEYYIIRISLETIKEEKKRVFLFFRKKVDKIVNKNYEEIVYLDGDKKYEFDIENFREERVSNKRIKETFEGLRKDKKNCYRCGNKFYSYGDKFECSHCHRYFCTNCHFPEKHGCKGDPKNFGNGFRRVYDRGKVSFGS